MRCYDGQPDSQFQAVLDREARIRKAITDAGYTVAYFPNGEFYQGFKDYLPMTKEHVSLSDVAHELGVKYGNQA